MSYRFADSLWAASGRISKQLASRILLASCQQTCMTYTIAVCTVKNSWWWSEELSETCKVLFPPPQKNWEISASSWFYYKKDILHLSLFKIEMESEYLNCEKNIPLHYIYIARSAMSPVLAQSLRCYLNSYLYLQELLYPYSSLFDSAYETLRKMKFCVHCQERVSILTAHIYRIL